MREDIHHGTATDYQWQAAYRYQEAREARDEGYHSVARVYAAAARDISQWAREAMGLTDLDQVFA
jgi:rubrerythrin